MPLFFDLLLACDLTSLTRRLRLQFLTWWCDQKAGTFLHVWWSRLVLQPFWHKTYNKMTVASSPPLEFTPAQHFNFSMIPKSQYYKSVAMHLISVARLCIPVCWKSTCPPSMQGWLQCITRIARMEELIYTSQDNISKFSHTWAYWTFFQGCLLYQTLLWDGN